MLIAHNFSKVYNLGRAEPRLLSNLSVFYEALQNDIVLEKESTCSSLSRIGSPGVQPIVFSKWMSWLLNIYPETIFCLPPISSFPPSCSLKTLFLEVKNSIIMYENWFMIYIKCSFVARQLYVVTTWELLAFLGIQNWFHCIKFTSEIAWNAVLEGK